MSRTAELYTSPQKTIYPIILLIIAFFLSAHFILEHISAQPTMISSCQSRYAIGFDCAEIDHQDDLAMNFNAPETLPHTQPLAISARHICLEQQHTFPIRIPPKITA